MTNAEKYLKDGEALMELPSRLRDYIDSKQLGYVTATMITDFFVAEAKPFLTEDERVILKNIQDFNYIERNERGGIELNLRTDYGLEDTERTTIFDHLFKSIKERRRI